MHVEASYVRGRIFSLNYLSIYLFFLLQLQVSGTNSVMVLLACPHSFIFWGIFLLFLLFVCACVCIFLLACVANAIFFFFLNLRYDYDFNKFLHLLY